MEVLVLDYKTRRPQLKTLLPLYVVIQNKIMVSKTLWQNKWIDPITPIHSHVEIHEFVDLWEAIYKFAGKCWARGLINSKWTADGEYTTKLTKRVYQIQFKGIFSRGKILPVSKAKADWTCHFLAFTQIYRKILTAINQHKTHYQIGGSLLVTKTLGGSAESTWGLLLQSGSDNHDPVCKLCKNKSEITFHLCEDCILAKEVWRII